MGVEATVGESSVKENFEVNDQVNVILSKVEANNFDWFNPETQATEEIQKWRWYFTVLDEGPWQGEDITGDTSTKFVSHPDCKAWNWASAIAGSEYPVGTGFKSDEITGMRCRILIGHKPSKKSDRVFMNVKDVMSPRTNATTAAAALQHDPIVDGPKF